MEGVTVRKIEPVYIDERGSITDLLNKELCHVGVIVTEKGSIRGNHYHNLSRQYTYILSGKFEVLLAKEYKPSDVEKIILEAGELIMIPPRIIHRFKALEKTVMIEMDTESRSGEDFEKDVVRIPIRDTAE